MKAAACRLQQQQSLFTSVRMTKDDRTTRSAVLSGHVVQGDRFFDQIGETTGACAFTEGLEVGLCPRV